MKMKTKSYGWHIHWGLLLLITLCFVGCKDDDKQEEVGFDPSKPVVVSDFTPKEGGLGSRLVVYGDNFGNDISKLKVTIGGQKAKVIGVKNQSLHCFIPAKAYEGDIEVSILDGRGEALAFGKAEVNFIYKKKTLVTTLIGETYENNTKFDVKDGPFDDCGGLEKMEWMVFDPNNHNRLYICGGAKSHRVVDFEKEELGTITFPGDAGTGDINILSFSKKGELIVVKNMTEDNRNGLFFFSPESGFKTQVDAVFARGCRAAIPHPINGEIYTSRYDKGWIGRYDPETKINKMDEIQLPYSAADLYVAIHPLGNYMYIMLRNKYYIMRSDYNWEKKTFMMPYLACGKYGEKGYADGIGNSARLNEPQQGCFVKNPDYEGQKDEYDFYFCDKQNQCVRKLTPEGRVSTFAGRPNGDGKTGFNDGDLRAEARFNYPASIVYDEERGCFFVGDSNNHRIRKIALEE